MWSPLVINWFINLMKTKIHEYHTYIAIICMYIYNYSSVVLTFINLITYFMAIHGGHFH